MTVPPSPRGGPAAISSCAACTTRSYAEKTFRAAFDFANAGFAFLDLTKCGIGATFSVDISAPWAALTRRLFYWIERQLRQYLTCSDSNSNSSRLKRFPHSEHARTPNGIGFRNLSGSSLKICHCGSDIFHGN